MIFQDTCCNNWTDLCFRALATSSDLPIINMWGIKKTINVHFIAFSAGQSHFKYSRDKYGQELCYEYK